MGEAKRKRSATQRLIAEFPDCCFCGGLRRTATREHMPPTSLFDNSHRPDGLVMPACEECNKGTSKADLAVALLSRWDYYSSAQEQLDHSKLANRIKKQAPELVAEWLNIDAAEKKRARQHLLNHGVQVPPDAGIATIGPLSVGQLNLFAHKVVLALYFAHFRRGLSNDGRIFASWRTKEDFARSGIPKFFLDLLPSYGTISQGQWDEHKTFEYRHAINIEEGLFGCLAKFRQGYFVYGFTVDRAGLLPESERQEWLRPADVLNNPLTRQKKL
jgi:hypothetical protein